MERIQGFINVPRETPPHKKKESSPLPQEPSDAVTLSSGPSENKKQPVELNIIHVNDMHGNISPHVEKSVSAESPVGGLAHMGSVVKQVRDEHPGSLLLNAGDLLQGSFESEISGGKPVLEVINHLGFDAVELGNHDFAWGKSALFGLIGSLATPVLAANVIATDTGEPLVNPSIMKEVKGIKVGIIGVDTPKIAEYVRPEEIEGMTFPGPEEPVKSQIARLKSLGADLIVVVSHLGLKDDRELAKKIPGIDVIVGGHTHSVLPQGEKVGDTIIVQAGCNNEYVGSLALSYDPESRKITDYRSTLIPVIADKIPADSQIEKILKPYIEAGEKAGKEIVGATQGEMKYSFTEPTPLGQHMADAIREAAGTKLALTSAKMLRAGLPAGEVTRRELFNSYPNTEAVVSVKIKGKHLKEELESRYASDSRAIMIPSGFSFTVDRSRPDGSRITSITINGAPFEPEREYDVGVTDNQARYPTFKTAREVKTKGTLRDAWFRYVKKHSPLTTTLDGRITLTGSPSS
ncbi:MAG: bifunctional UDP-sugar hydrolase/5'-nucleotidase [Candidatus Eremiobacteraeota bacterium]|nr:bifunctional UDP-sugar hydrolase/5'-nucleotidase [Candidatus Eremiobacteraeota bacterium]